MTNYNFNKPKTWAQLREQVKSKTANAKRFERKKLLEAIRNGRRSMMERLTKKNEVKRPVQD